MSTRSSTLRPDLSSTLRLDVVAAYGTAWSPDSVDRFRSGVSNTVEEVEHNIRAKHPCLRLRPECVSSEQAFALEGAGMKCAVAVLDVTDCDMALVLFAGRLQGAGVPYITVCRSDSQEAAGRIGLSSPNLVAYESMDQLFQADSVLQQELLRAVPHARIQEELVYRFWFPRETSTIWLVCPQIDEPGEFADRSSPDYTYLDNLGDTDALLEVMVFLSQYYPHAIIERFSSEDLPEGHTSSNLVVIGGPGSTEISNRICRDMMSAMHSHVAYSSDCEQMTVTRAAGESVDLRAEYRTNGQSAGHQTPLGLRTDWGYFARFKNPLNENAAVVLINGIHTVGVLGAARAFSERREAMRNFHAALASGVRTTSFECHFEVPVLNAQVKVPVVDPHNIFALGRAEQASTGTAVSAPPRTPVAEDRSSVKVLFIAGDRGGSQDSQLQIPQEIHAIQGALRACEHRSVITLANPILAATREKLAGAYRERPAVVHFAGHGNDRSLSIIDDHPLFAGETPLDADYLCDLLRTMQVRVRLCVLNSCVSVDLAQRLVDEGAVDCAVGWPADVSDSAAIAFSRALYAALGDGRCIRDAVSIGRIASGTGAQPVLKAADESDSDVLVVGEGDEP